MTGPTTTATVPRAAVRGIRIRRQAGFEARTMLRNGEQLLVAFLLPAMAMVGLKFASVPDLPAPRIDAIVPGVLALAVVSTAFTSQAIATAFDRRNGVLRLLGTTPLGRDGLLGGKILATFAVLAIHLIALSVLGLALGWRPAGSGIAPALITTVIGAACFVAIAMLVAGRLRAEAVLAMANLLWVLFLGLGLLLPTTTLPNAAGGLAKALPSGALGDALRAAFVHGSWPVGQWLVLLAWGGVCGFLATRVFRWSD
ncbi:ABC transporter permease [Nostocoides australiense]|uniref:Putative integral membrane transport protein n=1 Tax=Nostocoides australiense Ben110 TaxID=1193182 RepID=W6K062_9MICO|nr:ABC transporter permease [Tetrasphaera australiensis]MCA0290884.1 ABC transporter permease [Actinomycetota bacterium]MCB1300930.1 ABC transporter permease [Tetrasphaera sp.]CCH74406.1 putative integral membrane transport protein [Tetrasphaera australiensis Ben110]